MSSLFESILKKVPIKHNDGFLALLLDRVIKAFGNISVILAATSGLPERYLYEFVTVLSIYFVFTAISSLGLDSRVFSQIKSNSISKLVVSSYIRIKGGWSLFLVLPFAIVGHFAGIESFFIILVFIATFLIRTFDVYEYVLIGTDNKKVYSRIGALVFLISNTSKIVCIFLGLYNFFIFLFLIEQIVYLGICSFNAGPLILNINSYKQYRLVDNKGLFSLIISSSLTIVLLRVDQLLVPQIFDPSTVVFYLILCRLFEPALTFSQVLATFFISKSHNVQDCLSYSRKFVTISVGVCFLVTVICWVLLQINLLSTPSPEYAIPFLLLLGAIYSLNSLRVWFGKVLTFLSLYKVLMYRILIGYLSFFLFYSFSGFKSITDLMLGMFISMFFINFISIYVLWRYRGINASSYN